jgi:hypothetical protein
MEHSQLENIGNSQLFFMIKSILNEIELSDIIRDKDIMEDSQFIDTCDDSGKIVGVELEFIIDHNYLASTIKLNRDFDFSTSKPSGILVRPKAKLFKFEIDEFRVESVRRTYENELTSYSSDLVTSTVEKMRSEGSFDYYDGKEIGVDYYDGETTEVTLDKSSIKEVK